MNLVVAPGTSGLVAQYTFNQGVDGGDNSGVTTLYDSSGAYGKASPIDGALRNFALSGASSNWVISAAPSAVELSSLIALPVSEGIKISWSTASESNSYKWLVERSGQADGEYVLAAEILAAGSSNSGKAYEYTDTEVSGSSGERFYRLVEVGLNGSRAVYGPVSAGLSRAPMAGSLAVRPNPFRSLVTLSYQVREAGPVLIVVYNMLGQQIRSLKQGSALPGLHSVSWDGRNDRGQMASPGVYFAKVAAGNSLNIIKVNKVQ